MSFYFIKLGLLFAVTAVHGVAVTTAETADLYQCHVRNCAQMLEGIGRGKCRSCLQPGEWAICDDWMVSPVITDLYEYDSGASTPEGPLQAVTYQIHITVNLTGVDLSSTTRTNFPDVDDSSAKVEVLDEGNTLNASCNVTGTEVAGDITGSAELTLGPVNVTALVPGSPHSYRLRMATPAHVRRTRVSAVTVWYRTCAGDGAMPRDTHKVLYPDTRAPPDYAAPRAVTGRCVRGARVRSGTGRATGAAATGAAHPEPRLLCDSTGEWRAKRLVTSRVGPAVAPNTCECTYGERSEGRCWLPDMETFLLDKITDLLRDNN